MNELSKGLKGFSSDVTMHPIAKVNSTDAFDLEDVKVILL